MNYLAHIFLSGTNDEILVGNFMGDYVKGNDYNSYPPNIKKGLLLHRRIDTFTDRNKIVHQSMKYFAPRYHKYAGIIIDILYDHYLIEHWDKFCPTPLDEFKNNVFEILKSNYAFLPERVQFLLSSFIKNDWIGIYSTVEGIVTIFYRMSMRTTLPDHSEFAREVIRKYGLQLESEFLTFFPQLIKYVIVERKIAIPLKDNSIIQ